MVKLLSADDGGKVQQAVLEAEKIAGAEIAVVVARASDEYMAASLACGIVPGMAAALAVFKTGLFATISMPLCVEAAVIILFLTVPTLRHLCLRLEPAHRLKRRAAQRAAQEYLHLAQHLPSSLPVVMIYVSVAERYVHIHTSRSVREKIPDKEWNAVVQTLTAAVKTHGLAAAIIKAVAHAGEMLAPHFPPDGRQRAADVIELD